MAYQMAQTAVTWASLEVTFVVWNLLNTCKLTREI